MILAGAMKVAEGIYQYCLVKTMINPEKESSEYTVSDCSCKGYLDFSYFNLNSKKSVKINEMFIFTDFIVGAYYTQLTKL